jgi:hypothetical protein
MATHDRALQSRSGVDLQVLGHLGNQAFGVARDAVLQLLGKGAGVQIIGLIDEVTRTTQPISFSPRIPRRIAMATAESFECAFSFVKMLCTWLRTVWGET